MNILSLIFLGLSLCGLDCQLSIQKKIIGGEEAPPDKYRWAVSIKGDIHSKWASKLCGASILKTKGDIQWLVTAAHCFYSKRNNRIYFLTNPDLWHARVGLLKVDFIYDIHHSKTRIRNKLVSYFKEAYEDLFKSAKPVVATTGDIHIKRIVIHPLYHPKVVEYDIALMQLINPLPIDELKGVNAIELPDIPEGSKWPETGSECVVVGWGCTKPHGHPNIVAKLAKLKVWNNKKCKQDFVVPIGLNSDHEFCAGYLNKSLGVCHGDSGSGLACKRNDTWTLAGVVSAGHPRQPGQFPAILTRVSYFKKWILSVVEQIGN